MRDTIGQGLFGEELSDALRKTLEEGTSGKGEEGEGGGVSLPPEKRRELLANFDEEFGRNEEKGEEEEGNGTRERRKREEGERRDEGAAKRTGGVEALVD